MTAPTEILPPSDAAKYRRWQKEFNALDFVQFNSDGAIEAYCVLGPPKRIRPENCLIFLVTKGIIGGGALGIRTVEIISSQSPHDPDAHLLITLANALTPDERKKTYELRLVDLNPDETASNRAMSGFDPYRSHARFSDTTDLPADSPGNDEVSVPEINYLAKDYATFRRMMMDRLNLTMPRWTEQSAADLGVALVEVMAYIADYLSYFQDAVGTEAFLNTARRRISIRRHARLIDYAMHEGCNARAWVCLEVEQDKAELQPPFYFFAGHDRKQFSELSPVLGPADLGRISNLASTYLVFEPASKSGAKLFKSHNTIVIHTFSGKVTVLEQGSASAVLVDCQRPPMENELAQPPRVLHLHPGDVLIFEEIGSNSDGFMPDASHRQAVRLTDVQEESDPVTNTPILRVSWSAQDALSFPLTLIKLGRTRHSKPIENFSVARGNVILVDHGQTIRDEQIMAPNPASLPTLFAKVSLAGSPLTHREGDPATLSGVSASEAIQQDVRLATPCVTLKQDQSGGKRPLLWTPRRDLFGSDASEPHFVAEIDDDGGVCLRFGDGVNGRSPDPAHPLVAEYRIGNGSVGNVGSEQINCLVFPNSQTPEVQIMNVRNPLAARGGVDPEAVDDVRVYAPMALSQQLERAVTPDDYVQLAQAMDGVQRAAAWISSSKIGRQDVRVAIDAKGTDAPTDAFLDSVQSGLEQYRLIGQDVTVDKASYIPIELEVVLDLENAADAFHVRSAVQALLSNGKLPDGTLGFFHPDNFTFGTPVNVNRIVATCKIDGVQNATVGKLQRRNDNSLAALGAGELTMDFNEIAQLDNDPGDPSRGILTVTISGKSTPGVP